MIRNFLEVLAPLAPADDPKPLDTAARVLDALSHQVALVLDGLTNASAQQEILSSSTPVFFPHWRMAPARIRNL